MEGYYHPAEITRKISRVVKNPVGQATGETFGYVHAGGSQEIYPAAHVKYFDSAAFYTIVGLSIFLIILLLVFSTIIIPFAIFALLNILVLVLVVVFRERFFRKDFVYAVRIDADFAIGIPGEVYEDFRANSKNPIRTNVSVIIAGRTKAIRRTNLNQEKLMSKSGSQHFFLPQMHAANESWSTRVGEVVEAIATGLESGRKT
jgi:hypothetical protein